MFQTSAVPIILLLAIASMLPMPLSSTPPMALPGCPGKCGDITVPYPFGTKDGCYRPGFGLTCDESMTPPQLLSGNIKLLNINLTTSEITALKHISYICFNKLDNVSDVRKSSIDLRDTPAYLFSTTRNKFTVIGCNSLAYIVSQEENDYVSGCVSSCTEYFNSSSTISSSCVGLGCCQTSIVEGLNHYNVSWGYNHNYAWNFNPCTYAALVEEDWYKFNVQDLNGLDFYKRNNGTVPFVLDWAIRDNGTCREPGVVSGGNSACVSNHSYCHNTTNGEGYLCNCTQGYDGNPYILDGCKDIDECQSNQTYYCSGQCINKDGGYNCTCAKGYKGNGKILGNCTKIPDNFPYPARVAIVSILAAAILVAVCFLVDAYRQKKRYNKEKEKHRKYYEMMAGSVSVFTKKEIEIATNNFDENHVIGIGGHGKVYRGVSKNNDQIAIKLSKKVEESQKEEFVKEIVLLSRINHKNIMGILGCCLEEEIPILVYEYLTNGSLFDLLHGKKNEFISLATRIKIALGSAEALDYLHNSISRSILHGDVKSANILLDDNNAAKVSDFGASNLVPTNGEEFINLVQGTRGYLDPECLSTQMITKSSDVYSFGVVLSELITRKKAIYTDETNEKKNLAMSFASMANKNRINEMLDKEILNGDETVVQVLQEVSELALWCLTMKGDDRPTMKQVVEKLQSVVRFNRGLFEQSDLQDRESLHKESSVFTAPTTTFGFHSTESSSVLEIENKTPR